jgi:hypothetical protein
MADIRCSCVSAHGCMQQPAPEWGHRQRTQSCAAGRQSMHQLPGHTDQRRCTMAHPDGHVSESNSQCHRHKECKHSPSQPSGMGSLRGVLCRATRGRPAPGECRCRGCDCSQVDAGRQVELACQRPQHRQLRRCVLCRAEATREGIKPGHDTRRAAAHIRLSCSCATLRPHAAASALLISLPKEH